MHLAEKIFCTITLAIFSVVVIAISFVASIGIWLRDKGLIDGLDLIMIPIQLCIGIPLILFLTHR